jgi:hypothetical protein
MMRKKCAKCANERITKIFGIGIDDIIAFNPIDDYDTYERQRIGLYTSEMRYFVYVVDELRDAIEAALSGKILSEKELKMLNKVAEDQGIDCMIASFDYCYYIKSNGELRLMGGME